MAAIAADALAPIDPRRGWLRRWSRASRSASSSSSRPGTTRILTAVNSIVPALIAGNAVILKHAAQTLLVGERFQQAFDRSRPAEGLFAHLVLEP